MGVKHAPRDKKSMVPVKVLDLWHSATLLRHNEYLVGLNSQRRVVLTAGFGEMVVQNFAE